MTSIDPQGTTSGTTMAAPRTEVRGRAGRGTKMQRETKASLVTTEFWAMLVGVAALIVTYNVADDATLDLFRTCLLSTVLAAAYIVSRGWAKSGSTDRWNDRRDEGY